VSLKKERASENICA